MSFNEIFFIDLLKMIWQDIGDIVICGVFPVLHICVAQGSITDRTIVRSVKTDSQIN